MIYRTMRGRTFNYIELTKKFGDSNALYVGNNKIEEKDNEKNVITKKETTKVSLSNKNMKTFLQGKTLKENKVLKNETQKKEEKSSKKKKENKKHELP